jgi:NADP-dependent 3-hydroxy acid dehydrogenase YdfG
VKTNTEGTALITGASTGIGVIYPEMKQGILDRVAAWREGPPSDDISLVLVEVL